MIGLIKGTMRTKKALAGLPLPIASFRTNGNAPLLEVKPTIAPVQSGSGDPYPAGGGVNKWDEVWESGDLNVTTDGGNHTNANRIRSKNYIPVTPETSYYLTSSYGNTIVAFYDSSKAYPYNTQNVGWITLPANKVITVPNWCYYIRFYYNATTYSHDVALNYPSSVTTYSPYSNIRPISGWDSVKVSAVKQLFSGTLEQGSFNTGTGEKFPSTTRVRSVDDIPLPSGSYVLNNLNGWQFVLYVYDLEGNYKSAESYTSWKNNPLSFSLVANRKINFAIRNDTNTTIVPSDVVGLTLYDSTVGQTATIPLPHTVYGGELDIVSGSGSETLDSVKLSDLSWTYDTTTLNVPVFTATVSDRKTGSNQLYCEIYKRCEGARSELNTYNNAIATWNLTSSRVIGIRDDRFTDATSFTNSLGDTLLYYEVQTPTALTTSPVALQARNGQNNVWADAGDISELKFIEHHQYIGR